MKLLKLFPIAALVALVALSGCVIPPSPQCGNGVCETGETETCPQDCGGTVCEVIILQERDSIAGLEGRGNYEGETLRLQLDSTLMISQETYHGEFNLYDGDEILIDNYTGETGADLRDKFIDREGQFALESSVTVNSVSVDPIAGRGLVGLTVCR